MSKYILVAYEEVGYDITYEVEAGSMEEARKKYQEGFFEDIEEIDTDFVRTTHKEIISLGKSDETN